MTSPHIGIIGGGIAGSTAALHFSQLGLSVTVFEKGPSLVDGPPICHLHAGGNLYREISQQQCIQLLKESIETVRLYPHSLNVRPTVIAIPKQDAGEPDELLPRLAAVQQAYQHLIEQDPANAVLGAAQDYYRCYSREQLEVIADAAQARALDALPTKLDDWMIPFAQHVDLEQLKYPVVLVQEYGLSVFRLAATVNLTLADFAQCHVHTNTVVTGVEAQGQGWKIRFRHQPDNNEQTCQIDYLINASGYQTGVVDDWLDTPRSRLVEFKAAYVTHWPDGEQMWPEVIFHGERGTPQGMAQLTPYPGGYFQLHGMTEDITLFKDGLAKSDQRSSQPQLPAYLVRKLTSGWSEEEQNERTQRAITHMSQFVPSFASAQVAGKPLFGAQQVPGDDVTLRAANVSFAGKNYARLEIVKASSALEAAKGVEQVMRQSGMLDDVASQRRAYLNEQQVLDKAFELAKQRQYPEQLADIGGIRRRSHGFD